MKALSFLATACAYVRLKGGARPTAAKGQPTFEQSYLLGYFGWHYLSELL